MASTQPRRSVADVQLLLVTAADVSAQPLYFFLGKRLAFPLGVAEVQLQERVGGLLAAHHRVAGRGPGQTSQGS